jgi:hypothetical protein
MGFTNSYGIYGARVSPDGKLQDTAPLALAVQGAANQHIVTPALGANGDSAVMAMAPIWTQYCGSYLAASGVDVAGGKLSSLPAPVGHNSPPTRLGSEEVRSPAVAVGKDGGLVAILSYADRGKPLAVYRTDSAGKFAGGAVGVGPRCDRVGLAFDGTNYLLVADCAGKASVIKGWTVAPDGKPGAEFAVSNGSAANCLSPAAAAGPAGSVLVVYSEVRGNDDTKVVARIVK